MIYSLVPTCRACNVEPYAYLLHVLTELPQRAPHDDVTDLRQLPETTRCGGQSCLIKRGALRPAETMRNAAIIWFPGCILR